MHEKKGGGNEIKGVGSGKERGGTKRIWGRDDTKAGKQAGRKG